MRLSIPKFDHPPEIYEAIIREHRESPLRMGEFLMACGWTIGDAARAAVEWNLSTLAAAIAHEREKRNVRLTMLSEQEMAELKKQIQAAKKATVAQPPAKKQPGLYERPGSIRGRHRKYQTQNLDSNRLEGNPDLLR